MKDAVRRWMIVLFVPLWLCATIVVSGWNLEVRSSLQSFDSADGQWSVHVQAIRIGAGLSGVGFGVQSFSGPPRTDCATTVHPGSRECYEGSVVHQSWERRIGPLSREFVAQRLSDGLPELDHAALHAVADDIHGVIVGVLEQGNSAMTFAEYEFDGKGGVRGGGIAEGRLHALNAFGEPGEAFSMRRNRFLPRAGVMLLIGGAVVAGAAWTMKRQQRASANT